MSQFTDDRGRSELRAIRSHYRCTSSPGAPLAWLVTGTSRSWPARGAGGSGRVEVCGGKELGDDALVAGGATELSSARLR